MTLMDRLTALVNAISGDMAGKADAAQAVPAGGADGQVLTATGSGFGWEDAAGGGVPVIPSAWPSDLNTYTTPGMYLLEWGYDEWAYFSVAQNFPETGLVNLSPGNQVDSFRGYYLFVLPANGDGTYQVTQVLCAFALGIQCRSRSFDGTAWTDWVIESTFRRAELTRAANYTATLEDDGRFIYCFANDITITLPAPDAPAEIVIVSEGQTITIAGSQLHTVSGKALTIVPNGVVRCVSAGGDWFLSGDLADAP